MLRCHVLLALLFLCCSLSLSSADQSCTNCQNQDCVGAWTDWSDCTLQCGGGSRIRTFGITKPAIGNGKPCECTNGQLDVQTCNTQPCAADCIGSWSAWSGCSVLCGGGTATRVFRVTLPAVGTGTCPATDGQTDSRTCNTEACAVNCVGSWGAWSGCSKPCGGGVNTRSYTITTEASAGGVACPFTNDHVDSLPCNTQICPVGCVGSWSAWTECSKQCGGGQSTRTFSVTTPSVGSGTPCLATNGQTDTVPCNAQLCAVNCVGSWSAWSECSAQCGGGISRRTFSITTHAVGSGTPCDFSDHQQDIQSCNTAVCAVNCVGSWSAWGDCNVDCGTGTSSRTFFITVPAAGTGTACVASHGQVDSQTCDEGPCPVGCVGSWSPWTSCSAECGSGTSTRTFTITTPSVGAGTPCLGSDGQSESQPCNSGVCSVDCVGSWSEWCPCSKPCGGGVTSRTYTITTPAVGDGEACPFSNHETQTEQCNTDVCAVDCVGQWSEWSECSVPCGGGHSIRVFTITTNGAGAGAQCEATNNQTEAKACNTQSCPTSPPPGDCVGAWSAWSDCTQTCGCGSRVRTYSITQQAVNGGQECCAVDNHYEIEVCNTDPCPQDCCGEWSAWSSCSRECGGGEVTRSFHITLPAVAGGKPCNATEGQSESQECNTQPCPVNCVGAWTAWSGCSCECGGGTNTRTFNITTPVVGSGTPCLGADGQTESQPCNSHVCPVDCVGAWSAWSDCSAPCGGGNSTRKYRITQPAVGTGQQCPFRECQKEYQTCNVDLCPVDCVGYWSAWSGCSRECGGGNSTRTFTVTVPAVGTGAECCSTNGHVETEECNTHECPVNCVGAWTSWSDCSCECGGGVSTRTFNISTPVVGAGTPCLGSDGQSESQTCNSHLCARDCEGSWSAWTECSVPCGGGASSRTYHVTSPAIAGGAECPIEDLHTECVPCNAFACAVSSSSSAPVVGGGQNSSSSTGGSEECDYESSSSAPVVGGGQGSSSTGGSEECDYQYICTEAGADNLHGVPQCCYEYICGNGTGSGHQPKCGWKPKCTGEQEQTEHSANDDCEWKWYCPAGQHKPPTCAWRYLCTATGCQHDFYCGDATGSSTGSPQVGASGSDSGDGGDDSSTCEHGGDESSSASGHGDGDTDESSTAEPPPVGATGETNDTDSTGSDKKLPDPQNNNLDDSKASVVTPLAVVLGASIALVLAL